MSKIRCRKCGINKPEDQFTSSKRNGGECRACKSAYDAGYRAGKKKAAK